MGAVETKLRIMNDTSSDIVKILSWKLDSFRWVTPYRPDLQFANTKITSRFCSEKILKLNPNGSSSFFNMTLKFSDGTEDCFKINQKFAVGETPHFEHIKKTHLIEYEKDNDTVIITVKNTFEQLVTEKTQHLNDEGLAFMHGGEYERALSHFNAALVFVDNNETKNEILHNNTEALKQYAEHLIQEALKPENIFKMTKAEFVLLQAKQIVRKAFGHEPTNEMEELKHKVERKIKEVNEKYRSLAC